MFKKIDTAILINEFDTMQKTLKEDWIEWMRKSSVELLRQSPNLVLRYALKLYFFIFSFYHIKHVYFKKEFSSLIHQSLVIHLIHFFYIFLKYNCIK